MAILGDGTLLAPLTKAAYSLCPGPEQLCRI
jgi:hypothetical protein